ncbi:MAG: hypothetical protein ACYTGC_03570, partial [Planctomycetota bacterium]
MKLTSHSLLAIAIATTTAIGAVPLLSPDKQVDQEPAGWAGPAVRPMGGVAGVPGGPRDCPPGSNYSQRPHQPDEGFNFIFADVNSPPPQMLYENFQHDGRLITSIWFWGVDADPFAGVECDEDRALFDVVFYPSDALGQPDLANPICTYIDFEAREKNFKDIYPIPGIDLEAFQYKINFDPPCDLPNGEFWVSITGKGGSPECIFAWLTSPEGDGVSFFSQPGSGLLPADFDLSLCINRPVEQGPNCPADIVEDKVVNVDDLVELILAWGPCPAPCPPYCVGDIIPDCVVNVDDLVKLILDWGP